MFAKRPLNDSIGSPSISDRLIRPEVYVVAYSQIHGNGLASYLHDIGTRWRPPEDMDSFDSGEVLIEFAGRNCYQSFDTDINRNITKIREDRGEYLANVVKSGHGSVLEHVSITFAINNCSRVFTHELVRHRVGVAYSQESLRYVDRDFQFVPFIEDLYDNYEATLLNEYFDTVEEARVDYIKRHIQEWEGRTGKPAGFEAKKIITSAARRLTPDSIATRMVVTLNARSIRHIMELRTSPGVEEEFREIAGSIARLAQAIWPNLFFDFEETTPDIEGFPNVSLMSTFKPQWGSKV